MTPFQSLDSKKSALAKIGIDIIDADGNLKSVFTIIEELAELWDKSLEEDGKCSCEYTCSECKMDILLPHGYEEYKFCPYCGAKDEKIERH